MDNKEEPVIRRQRSSNLLLSWSPKVCTFEVHFPSDLESVASKLSEYKVARFYNKKIVSGQVVRMVYNAFSNYFARLCFIFKAMNDMFILELQAMKNFAGVGIYSKRKTWTLELLKARSD